jgi:ribosomal protein L27
MSDAIKPIVGIGTKFPAGTVKAINNDHVLLDTTEGVKKFSFSQIERFSNDARFISQA